MQYTYMTNTRNVLYIVIISVVLEIKKKKSYNIAMAIYCHYIKTVDFKIPFYGLIV